jgi:hypothetical protein
MKKILNPMFATYSNSIVYDGTTYEKKPLSPWGPWQRTKQAPSGDTGRASQSQIQLD